MADTKAEPRGSVESNGDSGTVALRSAFTDDELRGIGSFSDALELIANKGLGAPENFEAYGTGFKVVDKATLVGVPFMMLEWRFSDGDFGRFVSFSGVTEDGRKIIVNDGSTGVREQLENVSASRESKGMKASAPLLVREGLRVSEYDYTDEKGNKSRAKTYYLAD